MTQPDFKTLRDRLELEFAEILAPDLAENGATSIYIVLTSETDLQSCGAFRGMHSATMCRWLRPFIQNWSGLGPCMLLDDGMILDSDTLTAVATHELAHAACSPGLFSRDTIFNDIPQETVSRLFAESVSDPQTFTEKARTPRDGHGSQWLRACVHLTTRMQARGWDIRLPQVVNREFYGYQSMAGYQRALDGEPERLAHLPITSVLALPTPRKFLKLWARDVASPV